MKKTCFLIVCLLVCCSLSAVLYPAKNIGDLEISDIEHSYAREFMSYMEREGLMDKYFKSYEIIDDASAWHEINIDASSWRVYFWDDTDYGQIAMVFDDVYCRFYRWADIDLSDYSLFDILKSVNHTNLLFYDCGTLSYVEINGDLYSSYYSLDFLTTNPMSPSGLSAQLLMFKKDSELNFDKVKKEILGN